MSEINNARRRAWKELPMEHTPPTSPATRFALLREETGQALILPAVMLALLLGMAGLAVDVGSWYRAQRQAQAVADASALAAAQALPDDPAAATTQALDYANRNGSVLAASDITYSTADQPNDTVTVKVRRTEPSFFAKLFGVNSVTIRTTASARASDLVEADYAAPFAIINTQPELAGPGCPCYHVPTVLDLQKVGPGGFKILNIDGSQGGNQGQNSMAAWIRDGLPGPMRIGWFYSMPGAKFNASEVDAMAERVNTDMLFPIYDLVDSGGANLEYHVIGWAAFKPTQYDFQGSKGKIWGSFDRVTWQGVGGTGGQHTGPVSVGLVN
jgi:Flp pilus assembly protein TadG